MKGNRYLVFRPPPLTKFLEPPLVTYVVIFRQRIPTEPVYSRSYENE